MQSATQTLIINKIEHIISNAMVLLEYMWNVSVIITHNPYFGVVIMKFLMHVISELSKFAGGMHIFIRT